MVFRKGGVSETVALSVVPLPKEEPLVLRLPEAPVAVAMDVESRVAVAVSPPSTSVVASAVDVGTRVINVPTAEVVDSVGESVSSLSSDPSSVSSDPVSSLLLVPVTVATGTCVVRVLVVRRVVA